jgi:hypothetical protein
MTWSSIQEVKPETKFSVPDWGDIVDSGIGLLTFCIGPPAYVAWRAGTTTLCQSRLYTPSQVFDSGGHGQMFVQYVESELLLAEESDLLLVE